MYDALRDLPLLAHLTDAQREEVLAAGHRRPLERGEILFHEGEPADALFAVIGGQVKLVRYSPRGKEMLLHLVHPGQSFAEAALFGEGTYPATAEAVEPSQVWALARRPLEALVRREPALALAMLGSISTWTRRLAAKLELLTQRRVEERVAIYLLARAGRGEVASGTAIPLPEARHLIAAQCGTGPEVLSRTLRRLEDDGILTAAPDSVTLHRPDHLRALAAPID